MNDGGLTPEEMEIRNKAADVLELARRENRWPTPEEWRRFDLLTDAWAIAQADAEKRLIRRNHAARAVNQYEEGYRA